MQNLRTTTPKGMFHDTTPIVIGYDGPFSTLTAFVCQNIRGFLLAFGNTSWQRSEKVGGEGWPHWSRDRLCGQMN